MMNDTLKKHSRIIIIAFLSIFAASTIIIWYTVLSMSNYVKKNTVDFVVESMNTYMKETVDNFIIRMETIESNTILLMEDHIETLDKTIQQGIEENIDLEFLVDTISLHNHESHEINSLIYDVKSGEMLFESGKCNNKTINLFDKVDAIENDSAIYKEIEVGQFNIILHVDQDNIYDMTKDNIYTEIYNMKYDKNQYVWVNQIVNYDGGDNYAIRLIHPNLPETEGDFLSTYSEDVVGNLPYLNELNGIMENGEIFHQYYFRNLQNDNITEKISYARLYEKYDWIIATGIPLEDLDEYTSNIDKQSLSFIVQDTILIFVIFIIGFLGLLYLFLRKEKKYLLSLESIIKEEIEIDTLTGACTRKFANDYFTKLFKDFTKTGISSVVFVLDIDDFKKVNDTYGHLTGDIVLREIAQTILSIIRTDDCFIRWGGEEFILIIQDMTKADAENIANKLVKKISEIEYSSNDIQFHTTISIGGSMFLESDIKYEEAIARADVALYNVKGNGKNNSNLNFEINNKI